MSVNSGISRRNNSLEHLVGQWAEVIPSKLWVGSGFVAGSPDFFRQMGVQRVVNATRTIPNYFEPDGIRYLRVPVDDRASVSLWPYFNQVNQFIHQAMQDGAPLLLHCMAGQSRSVSLAIAYLILYHNQSFEGARNLLANQKQLSINRGFEQQLRQLEASRYQVSHHRRRRQN